MIRDMVKEGVVVADIGTDHALLPVMLVQNGKAKHVYACDISSGPLKKAEETVQKYRMENAITVIQSDGFQNVPADADTAIIAGMGYETAVKIMEESKDLQHYSQIVLELHCDPSLTRSWISQRQYAVEDESFIIEKGHAYTCISINPQKKQMMMEDGIILGPILKQKKDIQYIQWLKDQVNKIEQIFDHSKGKAQNAEQLQKKRQVIIHYLNSLKQ